MIPDHIYLVAQQNLRHYSRLYNLYKDSVPNNKAELMKLEDQIKRKLNGSAFDKLQVHFPIIGLQPKYNKLRAWINIYGGNLIEWKKRKDEAEQIVKQAESERRYKPMEKD